MNKSNNDSGLTVKRSNRLFTAGLTVLTVVALCATSCRLEEAQWETEDVTITMQVGAVSAGFIECQFTTSKDAYYLIDCVPVDKESHPYDYQKQFMTLAIDSAYINYLQWRYWLLEAGESYIAPFASHSLQYGEVDKIFTNLKPGSDYWVFAFVVNPETQKPIGKLYLQTVHTADKSIYNVHFDYRVRDVYDYIYPINDKDGSINYYFPYLAATRDSIWLADEYGATPEVYFTELFHVYSEYDLTEMVRYGVHVTKNDGYNSDETFQEGHTYYTAITSYDGFMGHNVIYKFTWTGEDCNLYFTDEDKLADSGKDD